MSTFAELAAEAIRHAGGRMTAQRLLLIEILQAHEGQLDAEDLFIRARERDNSLSIATVYRTLNTLESAGLVHRHYRGRDHKRRYFDAQEAGEAYLFTCRICKRVIPFRSDVLDTLKDKLAEELDAEVMAACFCVDGLCPECRSTQHQNELGRDVLVDERVEQS